MRMMNSVRNKSISRASKTYLRKRPLAVVAAIPVDATEASSLSKATLHGCRSATASFAETELQALPKCELSACTTRFGPIS
jgi:hypothetical protein